MCEEVAEMSSWKVRGNGGLGRGGSDGKLWQGWKGGIKGWGRKGKLGVE